MPRLKLEMLKKNQNILIIIFIFSALTCISFIRQFSRLLTGVYLAVALAYSLRFALAIFSQKKPPKKTLSTKEKNRKNDLNNTNTKAPDHTNILRKIKRIPGPYREDDHSLREGQRN